MRASAEARARCSTCRVRVDQRPQRAAAAIRAGSLRARAGRRERQPGDPARMPASAARPTSPLSPCCRPMSAPISSATGHRVNIGEERYVVSMFVDMRGSTKLAEARLPFDIVFLINRFLEAASQAVVDCRRATESVRRRWTAGAVRARCGPGDRLPAGDPRRRAGRLKCRIYEPRVRDRIAGSRSSSESAFMAARSSSATSAFAITPCSPRWATRSMSPPGFRT